MLYNEVRPHTFDAIKGQKYIVRNIRNQSIKNNFFQVYIFGGSYGTGKTTMARIISLAANCKHKDEYGNPCLTCPDCLATLKGNCPDVIELDAASNTGVDAIRDLKDTVYYMPCQLNKKVYIIDEVHMLSKGAFNALLKVLEEPPKHVIFVLCTTEVKVIPATVRSRAAKYNFMKINENEIFKHLTEVSQNYNINVEEKAKRLIARNSHGAMRDALALLEQAAQMSNDIVTEQDVISMLGIADTSHLFNLIKILIKADIAEAVRATDSLLSMGKDPFLMVSDLLDILSACIVASYRGADVVADTSYESKMINEIIVLADADSICSLMNGLMEIRDELRRIPERTTLICGIIRMGNSENGGFARLVARISEMEKELSELKKNGIQITTGVSNSVKNEIEEEKKPYIETCNEEKEEIEVLTSSVKEDDANMKVEVETKDKFEKEAVYEKEEISEMKVAENTKTLMEEKPLMKQEKQNAENPLDSFSMMNMFNFMPQFNKVVAKQVSEVTEMEKEIQKEESEDKHEFTVEEIDDYLLDLYQDHTIENALEIGCKRTVEEGKVIFTTPYEEIYRILVAYDSAKQFPFQVRLANS